MSLGLQSSLQEVQRINAMDSQEDEPETVPEIEENPPASPKPRGTCEECGAPAFAPGARVCAKCRGRKGGKAYAESVAAKPKPSAPYPEKVCPGFGGEPCGAPIGKAADHCRSCGARKGRRTQFENKGVQAPTPKRPHPCADCGKPASKTATRCHKCANLACHSGKRHSAPTPSVIPPALPRPDEMTLSHRLHNLGTAIENALALARAVGIELSITIAKGGDA